ncbi:hypothetical protein [Gallaecimonas sp. GXIMD4217]|uniref:hypothetical protein n=1 Tax=Gallaecimonas sp. GXIMD4217 TaxID=3131927 RepID=UPI00311ACEDA
MNKDKHQISAEDAQAALASVRQGHQQGLSLFRPPWWLNGLSSLLVGFVTIATALSGNSSAWTFTAIVTAMVLVALVLAWSLYLRAAGCRPRRSAAGSRNSYLNVAIGLATALAIVLGKTLYEGGIIWAPYGLAVLLTLANAFMLHKLPTGDWSARGKAQ